MENSQEMPKSHGMTRLVEPSHGWTTLIASGALTPSLLSALMLAAGFTTTLAIAPAQAAPAQLAADATAPVVSILRPTHADQLAGIEQIQVSVKAGRYPAQKLQMYVDDRLATRGDVILDASMLPVAVFNWDTRVFADGPHRLSVVIADSQGFETRANVQVYINNRGEPDIIPPTVRWVNVHHGDPIRGTFPVQVEATDNFGVKWVIISLNRAISPALKPALSAVMVNRPPYILTLKPNLPADTYILTATAWDSKDNRGDAPPIQIIYQPNFNPALGKPFIPSPPQGPLDITPPDPKPSGNDVAAGTDNGVLIAEATSESNPSAPRVSMAVPSRMTGDSGLIPPEVSDVIARAGLNHRDVYIAKIPSTPRVESRQAPAMPPALTVAHVGLAESSGQITGNTASLDHPQRVASTIKNLASPPSGESKIVPRMAATTRVERGSDSSLAVVPSVPSAVRTPRIAKSNAVQPQALPRVATSFVAPAAATVPQLAQSALTGTNIARPVEVRPRAEAPGKTLASMPPSARRVGAEQIAPQLTPMDVTASAIARSFPDMKPRPATGPSLAVLPKGAEQYPRIPSPDLILPIAAPNAKTIGISPVLPKKFAMNQAMPGKNAQSRALASITVAPQSEWGTVAEILPVSHTVRRDETLSSIARRYQMPVAVLAAANKLKVTSNLQMGAQLSLPRSLRVTYAGQPIKTDAASFMMGSVGVTPFRFLFEKQGGKLTWDAKTHRVTAKGAGSNVSITVGSRSAVINQKEVLMDLAAFLMSGRTMVPVRFFEQALQARVDWDPATGRIFVAMSNPTPV